MKKNLPEPRIILGAIVYIIVMGLYVLSGIFVVSGVGVLVFILFYGDLEIKNAQMVALGILMFLPLRYLKKRLENDDISIFKKRKEQYK